MNTLMMLVARYEKPTVPLEEVCEEYFKMSPHTAKVRAGADQLPIPAFKLNKGQKAPWFVHLLDLANLIDKQRKEAMEEWKKAS